MSVEATPDSTFAVPAPRPLTLLRQPHPALGAQQAFVEDAERVLLRAGTRGDRLTTALFLVLRAHGAELVPGQSEGPHLRCTTCRSDALEPAAQYPCPTAQQAFWALDATLG